MLVVLRNELEKLLGRKSTWFSVLLLNGVGIALLVTLVVLPEQGMAPPSGPEDALQVALARKVLAGALVVWANTFSLLATLVLAALSGSVFAAEFGDGSMQMLQLAPVRRLEVWAGKVAALLTVYFSSWVFGGALFWLASLRMTQLDPTFAGVLWQIPLGALLGTYVLLDLTTLAFFLFVSACGRSGVWATLGGLGAYTLLTLFHMGLSLAEVLPMIPASEGMIAWWGRYGFPMAVQSAGLDDVTKWVLKPDAAFPVDPAALKVSALWLVAFAVAGAAVFCRRESTPDA